MPLAAELQGSRSGITAEPAAGAPGARSLRRSIGAARRIGLVFGQVWVHVVPRLRAFDKDIGLRAELAGVIEAADAKADYVRPGRAYTPPE